MSPNDQFKNCNEITLILGAGFSKWVADLPIASNLFDFKINPFGLKESKKIKDIVTIKADWDRSNPNGLAEQFIAFVEEKMPDRKPLLSWYITRRLTESFILQKTYAGRKHRNSFIIGDTRIKSIQGIQNTLTFLNLLSSKRIAGVVTTNYDLLIEYSLGIKKFNYGVPGEILYGRMPYPVSFKVKDVVLTGDISLAKIHGSISWDGKSRYSDSRRGVTGNAKIVPPLPGKKARHILTHEWDLAESILKKSKAIIIIGFAFNQYDVEVLDLFSNSSPDVQSILVLDPKPNKGTINSIWPKTKKEYSTNPDEFLSSIKKWIAAL